MDIAPSAWPRNAGPHAAKLIAEADGIILTAGAGIGVDSGLPDFRGNEGFWKAYPALLKAGIHCVSSIVSTHSAPGLGLLWPSSGPVPTH